VPLQLYACPSVQHIHVPDEGNASYHGWTLITEGACSTQLLLGSFHARLQLMLPDPQKALVQLLSNPRVVTAGLARELLHVPVRSAGLPYVLVRL
jgi:hypothetical protein